MLKLLVEIKVNKNGENWKNKLLVLLFWSNTAVIFIVFFYNGIYFDFGISTFSTNIFF